MIVKVKELQPSSFAPGRSSSRIFILLQTGRKRKHFFAPGPPRIAYETVTDTQGGLPLLAPMSEVAGRLAIEAAALALRKPAGGLGKLLGGVPGVRPARVVVIGGGVVGTHATRMAAGLGADVVILDKSLAQLRQLDEFFRRVARTRYSTAQSIEEELITPDVVIGAVLVPGGLAPKLVARDHLEGMKPGAVLVDVRSIRAAVSRHRGLQLIRHHLCRGSHHSLLRHKHARGGSGDFELCTDQRHTAVWPCPCFEGGTRTD